MCVCFKNYVSVLQQPCSVSPTLTLPLYVCARERTVSIGKMCVWQRERSLYLCVCESVCVRLILLSSNGEQNWRPAAAAAVTQEFTYVNNEEKMIQFTTANKKNILTLPVKTNAISLSLCLSCCTVTDLFFLMSLYIPLTGANLSLFLSLILCCVFVFFSAFSFELLYCYDKYLYIQMA